MRDEPGAESSGRSQGCEQWRARRVGVSVSSALGSATYPATTAPSAPTFSGFKFQNLIDSGQGGVPREQKMLKGHLPRVIYHQVYSDTKI